MKQTSATKQTYNFYNLARGIPKNPSAGSLNLISPEVEPSQIITTTSSKLVQPQTLLSLVQMPIGTNQPTTSHHLLQVQTESNKTMTFYSLFELPQSSNQKFKFILRS